MPGQSKKTVEDKIWSEDGYVVVPGRLNPGPGRPPKAAHLFRFVADKLPYASLKRVSAYVRERSDDSEGVYLAHDSFGVARYAGRGRIFSRLASRKSNYPKELLYFSFFIIKNKNHQREIETAILRAASSRSGQVSRWEMSPITSPGLFLLNVRIGEVERNGDNEARLWPG
jgi:hypothetical protein